LCAEAAVPAAGVRREEDVAAAVAMAMTPGRSGLATGTEGGRSRQEAVERWNEKPKWQRGRRL
jgi:hypothetical protein